MEVPLKLLSWHFDDDPIGSRDEWNWVEITMTFDDGSNRWSILYTPDRLKNNLSRANIDPPGLFIAHMIIVRSYSEEDIERTLRYLESENELLTASKPWKQALS
ncbi:hypothetical protein ACFQ88_05845 [Paenibacillus sp. NPDC056579]|uniref:hypothetical protein n=1 Tax=Paenibacillus sp. NPDC056579 TaxID=3345871 RepID=UPI0036BE70D6